MSHSNKPIGIDNLYLLQVKSKCFITDGYRVTKITTKQYAQINSRRNRKNKAKA